MKPFTTCALLAAAQTLITVTATIKPENVAHEFFVLSVLVVWLLFTLFNGLAVWLAGSDSKRKPEPTGGQASYPNPPPRKLYPNTTPRNPDL